MQEMWVLSLSRENPLEKEMATHSSILAWKNPCTEEPGGYSPWGHKRIRHNLAMTTHVYTQVLDQSGFRICSLVEFLSTQMERLWNDTEFMDSRVPLSPLDQKVTGRM